MMTTSDKNHYWSYKWRFLSVLVLTAVVAGLGGILLHEFLEVVEKVVLGHGEELDPDPFMDLLNQYGLPWQVVENPVLVD
jgi:saccharopine dehydrogenase-like NADP-dependent oxidoreductase